MIEQPFPSLGLKDMHPMQVESLVRFIGLAFDLASQFEGMSAMEQVEQEADTLIQLFGGNSVKIGFEIEIDGTGRQGD